MTDFSLDKCDFLKLMFQHNKHGT